MAVTPLRAPITPHGALALFADELLAPDDGTAVAALRAIVMVLEENQLEFDRVLHRGLEALGSHAPDQPPTSVMEAALAILRKHHRLTHRAGQFLGGLVADGYALTDRQAAWLEILRREAGVLPIVERT